MGNSKRISWLIALGVIIQALCWLPISALAGTPATQFLASGWKLARVPDVTQSGSQISQASFDASAWIDAVVPGTVLTSYQKDGIIPDPYFGTNMAALEQSGYYNTYYWYRDEFYLPASYSGQKIWLNFDGINWKADIYVNGAYIGRINGPFIRGKFNITSYVAPGATNCVAVMLYWCNATVYDSPTFVGADSWDFMPAVAGRDVGLYQDVYLNTSGSVKIVDPFIVTTLPLPNTSPADLSIQVGLTNCSGSSVSGTLSGIISPDGIEFQTNVTVNASSVANITLIPASVPQLSVTNPALWWPNGYGPQNLHNLQLSFQSGGNTSDVQNVSFGIRQYSYNTNGHDLQLSCNGQKILCKGGNWGIADALLQFTPAQLDMAVRLHKEMNFNMIRCWHGNCDLDAFYDACDKYGIMVWDEFWLNGSNFGLGPTDTNMFIANSIDKYKRLRNRACLAVWCGENEASPPASLQLSQNYSNYDNTRIYFPASNAGGIHGGGPYAFQGPKWYFQNAYGFTTEIGLPSVPSVESIQAMMPAASLWPLGDTNWLYHNWAADIGNKGLPQYTNAISSEYGPATNISDFCEKAQLLNLENYKAIFEAWNAKLFDSGSSNPDSGVLIWMSQPAWPSLIWQAYDWNFDLGGAFFGCKKGCEPVHIQWDYDDNSVRIVNATAQNLNGLNATIQVYNLNGVQQYSTNVTGLNVSANTVNKFFTFSSGLTNLALNRPAYASSIDNANDAIPYAVDGNLSTRWSSAYSDPQWYYVDLGSTQMFDTVSILWETAYPKAFQIQVSNDAGNWATVWSTNGMTLSANGGSSISSFSPVNARYVRMYGTQRATIWGYSMFEFQVLDTSASSNWMNNLSSTYFIKLKLNDGGGDLLSDNFYWVGTSYLNFTDLNSLPPVNPECNAACAIFNGMATITATITNASTNVVFDAVLKLFNQTTGTPVLPAIYSDNYFSLLPGEARTVTIQFDTNSVVASGPLNLMLNGWNVPSQPVFSTTINPTIPTISPAVALPSGTVDQWTPVTLICSNWTGAPPYNFQWQRSGTGGSYTNVSGATTNRLSLANATLADSGYYRLVFTANSQSVTSSVAPLTVLGSAGGATGPRLSIKFAADLDYGFDAINNGWPAGVLNTKQWFNFTNGTGSGAVSVPFYSVNDVTSPSRTKLVYSYPYKYNTINEHSSQPNNISLVDSYISMNDGWYLSVTNLDPVFTNGYRLYFYYLGIAPNTRGQNYIRCYSGLTTNTPLLGIREWNLYTTATNRDQTFIQDMTPLNTDTADETPGANYFVISNLSGGAFDLLITNSFYGGVSAIEIVANQMASGCALTASITNAVYGTPVTFTNRVVPIPANGEHIAFMDGNTILGTGTINNGIATFTISSLAAGDHSISAVYGGNGNYLASTSSVVRVSVIANPTLSPAVALPSSNVYAGKNVTLVCSNYAGFPPYGFQWQVSGDGSSYTNVNGRTTNALVLSNVQPGDSGYYQLIFSADGLSVTSSVVQLTVADLPIVDVQGVGGKVILNWTQGTLLTATNLTGPWTTNNATSPYTNRPDYPQMFYRILTQ